MTQEQLQKLNEICEDNGFVIKAHTETDSFVIEAKNEWEGVEFAENTLTHRIFKIKEVHVWNIALIHGTLVTKSDFKPSTEQAYKQQLIAEAKEKFGEIKDGDRFKREWKEDKEGRTDFVIGDREYTRGWNYDSNTDSLHFHGYTIYEKGKWAERVEEHKGLWLDYNPATKDYRITISKETHFNKMEKILDQINKILNEKD